MLHSYPCKHPLSYQSSNTNQMTYPFLSAFLATNVSISAMPGAAERQYTWFAFLILGVLLYLISNPIFGRKREVGKRLILFIFGGAAGAISIHLSTYSYQYFIEQDYPSALGIPAAVILVVFSIWLVSVSIFCSNEYIGHVFDAIIKGL